MATGCNGLERQLTGLPQLLASSAAVMVVVMSEAACVLHALPVIVYLLRICRCRHGSGCGGLSVTTQSLPPLVLHVELH